MMFFFMMSFEPGHEKTNTLVSHPADTNQAAQPQKTARGPKPRTQKAEGLYHLCSENKGADQLRGYREADLRLLSHMQNVWFLMTRLI